MSARYVVGDTVVNLWTVLDLSSDPLTGMTTPTDVTFTLHRSSGASMVASTETISFTEIGVTGEYTVSFVPGAAGLYVLQLKELNINSLQRTFRFEDMNVLSAGAEFTPSYGNAYCAEDDIERWLQQEIDTNSEPDDVEATGFAESRASILTSLVNGWGFPVTPSTVTAGSRLEDLLRRANSIGAAIDYTLAQNFGNAPSQTERANALQMLWMQLVGDGKQSKDRIVGELEREVKMNLASLATDHILSGDTTAEPSTTPPVNEPIGFGVADLL